MEIQKTLNSQSNLEKEEWNWRNQPAWLQALLQSHSHQCIEQSFGLCGRGRGWDDLGEWHWNMCNIISKMNHQSRFDAGYRMLRAGALGWHRGMVWGGGFKIGRRFKIGNTCTPVADSCWCTVKPIQYCKVISLQINIKKKKRVTLTARRSNQSILKEINAEYSLEGLMLKLKLQYFGHLMWRAYSLEKTLMLERLRAEEGNRRWYGWTASLIQWTWIWANSRR